MKNKKKPIKNTKTTKNTAKKAPRKLVKVKTKKVSTTSAKTGNRPAQQGRISGTKPKTTTKPQTAQKTPVKTQSRRNVKVINLIIR